MQTSDKSVLDIIREYQQAVPVDVWAIARAVDIKVWTDSLPDHVSGKIVNEGGSPAEFSIIINAQHHPNRQRFTVAHELAHYVLHRDLFTEVVDNTMFRADGQTMSPTEERHANQLAANILMPMRKIKEFRAKGHRDPKDLARIFGVSEAAMRIHTGQQVDVINPRGAEFEDELEDG